MFIHILIKFVGVKYTRTHTSNDASALEFTFVNPNHNSFTTLPPSPQIGALLYKLTSNFFTNTPRIFYLFNKPFNFYHPRFNVWPYKTTAGRQAGREAERETERETEH